MSTTLIVNGLEIAVSDSDDERPRRVDARDTRKADTRRAFVEARAAAAPDIVDEEPQVASEPWDRRAHRERAKAAFRVARQGRGE